MQALFALTILLAISAEILPAHAQGRRGEKQADATPAVDLGDFLWQGKYYRAAKASVANGTITIRSAKDGVFQVPVATAPTDLRKKLGLPDAPPPPPKAETFPLFGLSESDLAARYGTAVETGPSALLPATKVAVYNAHGMRLTVHFLDGKSGVVLASRFEGKVTPEEAEALMARCGRGWMSQGSEVYKSVEGAIAVRMEATGILTIQSAAFLAKKGR